MRKVISMPVLLLAILLNSFAQNVGIGITTPSEKLHVAGNIKADTIKPNAVKLAPNAGAGKVLTSDAAGNANWQSSNAAAAAGNIGYGVWGDCATNGNISEYNPVADATGAAFDYFGNSVSISGNYAIVGAHREDAGQGSASIYQYNGSSWILMQKLTDSTGATGAFGYSVSISGNYAIAGTPLDDVGATDKGSASIYQYNGSSWVLMQKITDPAGVGGDYFGYSVSISGNYAMVGAAYGDVGGNINQGSASIYQYKGSTWVLMQKITDSTGAALDYFGWSVSISGNYAIVGAYLDEGGAASIYWYNGSSWVLMQKITSDTPDGLFGISVSISGNYAIMGADESASIYQFNGSSWVLMQQLTDATSFSFGYSVSISGNFAIVGALRDVVGANTEQGAASIYLKVGNSWGKLQYITDPMGNASDHFGNATAIDGATKRFLIGAREYANGNGSGKAVFGKVN